MAHKKISELTAIAGASVSPLDLLPLVDVSEGLNKSITREEFQTFNAGTLTTDKKVLDLSATWNNAAVDFNGIKYNATNTLSGDESNLINLQVNGATIFRVRKDGFLSSTYGAFSSYFRAPKLISSTSSQEQILTLQGGNSEGKSLLSSGTFNAILINHTYQQTGTAASTDLIIQRTNTTLGSGVHKFIDMISDGSSKFSVSSIGNVTMPAGAAIYTDTTLVFKVDTITGGTNIGYNNTQSSSATTVGYANLGSNVLAIAIGASCTASGLLSVGIGYTALGVGTNAVAIGYIAIANGLSSCAIGYGCTTDAGNSVAMGKNVTNNTARSLEIGASNTAKMSILETGDTTLPRSLRITGATETTSVPALNVAQTWNAVGTAFTATKVNVTDTASAAASLLMDLQVGDVSKFKVTKTGNIELAGYAALRVPAAAAIMQLSGTAQSATGATLEVIETTAPGAGSTNAARIYAEDNGAGKTRLMVQFATGAPVQIAIEP